MHLTMALVLCYHMCLQKDVRDQLLMYQGHLTQAEQRYAQTDEDLGLIFGVQRFHQYVYGKKFVLVTDHKPLLSIIGHKNALVATRFQRWAVLLSAYSYDVEFRRTKRHTNADSLSRLLLKTICSIIIH